MATMLAKVLEIERHQVADYARVDYAIKKGEDEIAALEELWLGPNELRREASVLRDRTVLAVREVRNNMAKRAITAKSMQGSLVESLRAAFTFCCGGHCRREFTRALLREFEVHTDPYAHLSLHRRDQGWRLRSRRECSL
jgi:hypothetical protein